MKRLKTTEKNTENPKQKKTRGEKPGPKKTTNKEIFLYLQEIQSDLKTRLTKIKNTYEKPEKEFQEMVEKLSIACKKNEDALEKLFRRYQDVEETLRNVHLAIRQNEYLQAWYPAQHGYPEMKVVGKHPVKEHGRFGERLPRC